MLTFNVITVEDAQRINGTLNSEVFNLPYSTELLEQLKLSLEEFNSIEDVDVFDVWTTTVKAILTDNIKRGEIVISACPDLMCDEETGKYYMEIDGALSKAAVPDDLVTVLLESIDKDIDPTPIIKAWVRFLRNPFFSEDKANNFAAYITSLIIDYDEVEKLIEEDGYTDSKAKLMATYNDVAITQEGLIVTKKYAELLTEGWKIDPETNEAVKTALFDTTKTVDVHSGEVTETVEYPEFAEELTFQPPMMGAGGNAFSCDDTEGHIIKVGHKHTLKDWSMVNTNDYASCVPGLHIGGMKYVASYSSLNAQLLECFVDPAEIGAICDVSDYSDGAIRCREYLVYGAVGKRTKGLYHSSHYAAMKDEEWLEYKKAAIESANSKLELLNNIK